MKYELRYRAQKSRIVLNDAAVGLLLLKSSFSHSTFNIAAITDIILL